jgi:hypothetical protein
LGNSSAQVAAINPATYETAMTTGGNLRLFGVTK